MNMDQQIIAFYSQPQIGGALPFFAGSKRHQTGGGFLGTLGRFAIPLLKWVGSSLGRIGIKTLEDVVTKKKSLKRSLADNAMHEVETKGYSAINKMGDIFDQL